MKIDLSQITAYREESERHKAALQRAKTGLEFCRLQMKQTKESLARAKVSPLVKDIIKAMPKDSIEVMPAPGVIYVTAHVSQAEFVGAESFLAEHFRLHDSHDFPCHTNYQYRSPPGEFVVFHAVVRKF